MQAQAMVAPSPVTSPRSATLHPLGRVPESPSRAYAESETDGESDVGSVGGTEIAGFERALATRSGRMDRPTFSRMLQQYGLQWDPSKRAFYQARSLSTFSHNSCLRQPWDLQNLKPHSPPLLPAAWGRRDSLARLDTAAPSVVRQDLAAAAGLIRRHRRY